ncbi:hypothetical protein AAMO2058_000285200 [Amorphochlora amoebiformis]
MEILRDHRTGTLQPLKRRRSKGKLSHSSITDSDNRSRSLSFLEDGEDYSQPEPHNHRYHRSGVRHPRHHRASNASEVYTRRSEKINEKLWEWVYEMFGCMVHVFFSDRVDAYSVAST